MGRPESQLSSNDPRLLAFANDLRRLRKEAGSPSYRQLAQRAHYSPAALSQAANGRAIPSLEVTLGFVRACGGDVAGWERRWRELNAAVNPDGESDDLIASDEPSQADPRPDSERNLLALGLAPDRGAERMRRVEVRHLQAGLLTLASMAICALALIDLTVRLDGGSNGPAVVGTAATSQHRLLQQTSQQSTQQAGKANPVADGSDPNRAGCSADAVTMAWTRVHFPTSQLSGEVELRYSPHCRAAWARFEPAKNWSPGPSTMVTVWTIRPADQATRSYSVEFGGEVIIGNMLMTARGCILAEVTMVRGATESPVATTTCLPIN